MLNLWSRAAPAQSTCRCVSCLSTTASGVTSQSAAAASKRRLRIGNSVTALYTSIFAAAALADGRAKDKRRHDWDEKIAAVKAEVNELMDEEKRILKTLESRRGDRGLHRLPHRGGLHAIGATPPTLGRPSSRSFHTGRRLLDATGARVSENLSTEAGNDTEPDELKDTDLLATDSEFTPDWALEDKLRVKAIQKLALRQFSIRMLLRPLIAHDYLDLPMNYAVDRSVPQINVRRLLDELNNLRHRIRDLKTRTDASFDDLIHGYVAVHPGKMRDTLNAQLYRDISLFTRGRMSQPELLLRIANNLLESVDPDRTAAFRYMIMAFTRARQDDLVQLLLRTLLPNHFNLTTPLILTILAFLRKSKDLKNFDLFLEMLSGDSQTVNIGLTHYERRRINGVDIVVPQLDSTNPVIYDMLISAALKFDQPDRADAWLQAARSAGFFDNFSTLISYLRFYSIRQDWEKGMHTLKRAVTFLVSSTDLEPRLVERLLVRMAHLCDSCNRTDASEALITAAMHSGFVPDISWRHDDVKAIVDPHCERWTKAAEGAPMENLNRPLWQKCYDFANTFGEHLTMWEVPEDSSTARRCTKMAGLHAQDALSTALAGHPSDFKRTKSDEAASTEQENIHGDTASQNKNNTPAPNPQAEDITALKNEVAQLHSLVRELRKHHIQASFKDDDDHTQIGFKDDDGNRLARGETEIELLLQRAKQNLMSSSDTPTNAHHQAMSVEFERTSSSVDSDKTSSSDTPTHAHHQPLSVKFKRTSSSVDNDKTPSSDPPTNAHHHSMSVEFERTSRSVDSDKSETQPSVPRKRGQPIGWRRRRRMMREKAEQS